MFFKENEKDYNLSKVEIDGSDILTPIQLLNVDIFLWVYTLLNKILCDKIKLFWCITSQIKKEIFLYH